MAEFRNRNESVALTENIPGLGLDDEETVIAATVPKIDANLLSRAHFYFGRTLGEGSYARVVHAKMKLENSPDYAIKIMEKSFIQKEKKVKYVLMEKEILSIVNNPFIIKLHYTFQDADYLYMCMDLARGGELRDVISRALSENSELGRSQIACSIDSTRFYIGELVEALEYLHKLNIVHMDIKPENILITSTGHIQIADFGTSLRNPEQNGGGSIFVGTAEYVSPEILNADTDGDTLDFQIEEDGVENSALWPLPEHEKPRISRACDLWAVGCILYQMLCGRTPFSADTEYLIFVNINGHLDGSRPLAFPPSIAGHAQSLISSLLTKDPQARPGGRDVVADTLADAVATSYLELKNHPFFEGCPWGHWLEQTPPYVPSTGAISDVLNDGANDDWMLEGEATPIMKEFNASGIGGLHDQDIDDDSDEFKLVPLAAPASPSTAKARWLAFLNRGESQVFTGLVSKRVGLFSKRRQLILTDTPRLIYVDPETMEKKGEIPWTKEQPVSIVVVNNSAFDVFCAVTRRHYHFTDCDGAGSIMWQELVGAMLEKQKDPSL